MHKSYRLAISTVLMAVMAATSWADTLTIMHTNDLHSQVDPFTDSDLGGIGRRKVLIDSIRAEHDNVLLIDLGDNVQGSLFFNIYKGQVEEMMMNYLGYDMRILGNHEFDNGMQMLADNLKMSNAELLSSNYILSGTPLDGLFHPYSIRQYGDKRIAFVPINLQPKGMISTPNYQGMGYLDYTEAAESLAWYMKNIEHVDAVIVLSHIGYDDDVTLIQGSKNIDVVIGGHSHTLVDPDRPSKYPSVVKNAEGRDVLIAQMDKGGKHLGLITIDLDSLGIALPKSRAIPVDKRLDARVSPDVEELIAPFRAQVDALNQKKVAKASTYLSKDEPAILNLVADMVAWRGRQLAGDIDLAIMNKGGLRNDLPKGDISEGQIISLMPFFNRVLVIEIPGDSLIKNFEIMAAQHGQGVSDNVSALFDRASGQCLQATISGQPIDPDRTYRIATIDYLADGGDYMHPLVDHVVIARSPNIMFEDMIEYLSNGPLKGKKLNPSAEMRMAPKQ